MSGSLVGAYGMLWDRHEVDWSPGSRPTKWQLLGFRGTRRPTARICDFRHAKGFYVLFDDFRATYAGLARGNGGIGERLKVHHLNPAKRWTRFCWFAFDGVLDAPKDLPLWSELRPRDALKSMSAEAVLRESEALLIAILGLADQNKMRFQDALEWSQLTPAQFVDGGVGLKVEPAGFTDDTFSRLARR